MSEENQQEEQDFGWALKRLKGNQRVAREGWNGNGMHIALQTPDAHSKMRRPYLFMYPVDGALVPWVASQTDILATDWYIVA